MSGRINNLRLAALAVPALSLCVPPLYADAPVSGVAVQPESPTLVRVSARVSLPLDEAIQKAVHHGVPLVLLTEVTLERERPWIWDEELGRVERRSELRYHALSGRYLLQSDGQDRIENFGNLEQAFRRHGEMSGVPLELKAPRGKAPETFRVAVRGRVELQDLPFLARIFPLGAAAAWYHDTGWLYFLAPSET
jgi:hypothetical protein